MKVDPHTIKVDPSLPNTTGPGITVREVAALNALRLPVEPGLLSLRLRAAPSREGLFDGAWWPRSRDVQAELPRLVAVLTEHLGHIGRIGLDADAWDGLGEPLFVDGRLVHVDWFPVGDDTIIVTRGDMDHFSLLVVPPEAEPDEAHAAMAMATHVGNTDSGQQILVATGIVPPARQRPV